MRNRGLGLAVGIMVLSVFWTILLILTPFFASEKLSVINSGMVIAATYAAGSLVCHQLSDRSFKISHIKMPVCARCAGLYAAAPFGALVGILRAGRGRVFSARRLRVVLIAATFPTVMTVCGELIGLISPTNMVRSMFALPLGFTITWTLSRSLIDGLWVLPESS